uniref:Disulfide bond formation protein B n=1 Tax=Dechloromonas aromatica (strain RCB) TaxID=159087 RepID=DSBB_DECAR|nr:RecName: Full=Disulfide bond formation protein B; AltName: Full=Disulfide oxidoreductase [Dechloromonas aromatica RCB]
MICSKVPVRAWFATLGLGCLGLVAVGMALQTLLHLAPCPLCIFQRLLYIMIGFVGLLGFVLPAGRLLWSTLAAGLGVLGFGVAAYQTWMQAFPDLAPECGFTDPNAIERLVDWLGMEWPSMFLATGFCTSRDWELLGLSMANWSVLIFAGIVAYAVLLFVRKDRA